ncbi:hypothetical protein QAD02_022675 [Eretmocerus hayati]|uniref:Uncharacterized protein n=1 Tax=Eretmocerus hayati TaxID=131215 RepID=A0ACC2PVB4_9HYME|nr:hypothetical protein QAD02_022675 [Eretmocerus hayati]
MEAIESLSSPTENKDVQEQNEPDEKEDPRDLYRRVASQYVAAFASNIVMFTSGTFFGFTTVFIVELGRSTSEIQVTEDELSWYSSSLFMHPVGAITIGMASHWLGSRSALRIASLLNVVACLLFYKATSSWMILLGQALAALAYVNGPGVTYIVEISQPNVRGVAMATANFSQTMGSLFCATMANLLHWRTVILVNCGFAVLGAILTSFIPDSPYWLAIRGRSTACIRSLAWLRGWTTPERVKGEFEELHAIYIAPKLSIPPKAAGSNSDIDEDIPDHQESHHQEQQQGRLLRNRLVSRSFLAPLGTMTGMFALRALVGSTSVQSFSAWIMKELGTEEPGYMAVGAYVFDIAGALTYMSLARSWGRRRLLLSSLVAAALLYTGLSLWAGLGPQLELHPCYEKFFRAAIPSAMILILIWATSAGLDTIVGVLNAELFPSDCREIGAMSGMLVSSAGIASMQKAFPHLAKAIGLAGLFGFFGASSVLGFALFGALVPETEGKSLREIENHYATKRQQSTKRLSRVADAAVDGCSTHTVNADVELNGIKSSR